MRVTSYQLYKYSVFTSGILFAILFITTIEDFRAKKMPRFLFIDHESIIGFLVTLVYFIYDIRSTIGSRSVNVNVNLPTSVESNV